MKTELTADEMKAEIAARYAKAVADGVFDKLSTVAREFGWDPASRDEQGRRTGYCSTYGPKYIWKKDDISVYVDDYGHYMNVFVNKREVASTHSRFIIPGPWIDVVLAEYPAAMQRAEERERQRDEAERERLRSMLE